MLQSWNVKISRFSLWIVVVAFSIWLEISQESIKKLFGRSNWNLCLCMNQFLLWQFFLETWNIFGTFFYVFIVIKWLKGHVVIKLCWMEYLSSLHSTFICISTTYFYGDSFNIIAMKEIRARCFISCCCYCLLNKYLSTEKGFKFQIITIFLIQFFL